VHYVVIALLLHSMHGTHMCAQVELMVARFTNLRPFPPLGWQRGLIGMLLGAVPHAFEGLLGFLIDVADGDEYYRAQHMQRFRERHPGECVAVPAAAQQGPMLRHHRARYCRQLAMRCAGGTHPVWR
jgi:hypothetical protein